MEKVVENSLLQAAKVVEDQIDAEIEKLENLDDDDLEVIRQKRISEMKKQISRKNDMLNLGHGEYSELSNEKEFFDACKKSQNFVCHFYRNSTFRCKIVDKHLESLAKKHIETRFCKIDAEKSPFLTSRLKIHVLPTIALSKDAKIKDFIVGFDDLGGIDDFSTEIMEWRIAQADVINYSGDLLTPPGSSIKPKISLLGSRNTKNIRGEHYNCEEESD